MIEAGRDRTKFLLANLLAAAPIVFGIIRRIQSGHDWRLFHMAIASLIGVLIVRAVVRRASLATSSTIVFVVTVLLAAVTGYALGARAGPGIVMVAVVLALCWTASHALYILSRPRPAP